MRYSSRSAVTKVEAFPSGPLIDEFEHVVEAPAGSHIVFDATMFHRATNRSDRPRRAVNHVYTLPFIGQNSSPATLGGRYSDDPATPVRI